jgi:hypothetical protein
VCASNIIIIIIIIVCALILVTFSSSIYLHTINFEAGEIFSCNMNEEKKISFLREFFNKKNFNFKIFNYFACLSISFNILLYFFDVK